MLRDHAAGGKNGVRRTITELVSWAELQRRVEVNGQAM
jgi:hypothetical protein